ncbi:outer membrane receptor protein [Aequorivita sublithincola DSM 14238]|uniref:Outer membrane receptor protein n=1 Tax=Aequorivita sublithincola (strain DSM 14238 / LMG 21431 / ACAM 643 / 9-3) TaxID=746697 RepID=I3YU64_AEQSU|nr:TonB-dependent receptor [Aequorivita sublithincola]AFL80532.1 outer membrane receptor protein [Aequorivita sublithincola DSM 14238]
MKIIINLLFIFLTSVSIAQTSTIVGKLTDTDYNNEPLPFANIFLKGTTKGITSDIDGLYSLDNIEPGTYTVVYSFVGYETVEIPDVKIIADKVTNIDVPMGASAAALDEVVIKTTTRRESAVVLLLEQKKAVGITQSIGAEDLARKGVSDAEGAVTKVTGIKKQAGVKNIFVRGLGDRYNSTTLNELPLPSEDPEYKNISLDFLSSDVIESVGINKTFSVPLYGDVAGANINIVSKELTGPGSLQFSISPEVNSRAIGKQFLMMDNAKYIGNIHNVHVPITDLKLHAFDNNFKPNTQNAQLNSSYSLSGGKRFDIGNNRLSLFFVGNFDNKYEYRKGTADRINAAGGYNQEFSKTEYNYHVSKLAMANVKWRFPNGDYIAANSMFIKNNSQSVADYYGLKAGLTENDEPENPIRAFIRRQQENENNLFVNQLLTSLTLNEKLSLEAGASYNTIRGYEPDRRTNTYVIDVNADVAKAASGSALNNRFYSNLEENDLAGKLYLDYELNGKNENTNNSRIRLGYNYRDTDRTFNYTQLNYILDSPAVVDIDNPDISLFNQQSLNNGIFRLTTNRGDGRDGKDPFIPFSYDGKRTIHSGLGEVSYDFSNSFSANVGVRYEKVKQEVLFDTNLATTNDPNTDPSLIDENFVLPSFNLKYNFTENSIVRLAGSKTYTLPQFKEVAPFLYEDVSFNSFGNPDLLTADNYNLDLKYEYYFSPGEIVAVTGFYKNIKNAINRIEVNSAAGELSYVNTGDATIAGVELELRKNILKLSTDSNTEKTLTFGLNASYLYSNQKLEDVPTDNLTVRFTNKEDELEGSSPFILGSDLTLNLKKKKSGITSSVVFNYNSKSIYSLGTGGDDANPGSGKNNIMLSAIPTLDFINKISINENFGIKLNIKNILDPEYKLTQEVNNIGVPNASLPNGQEVPVETYKRGVVFSAGVSYSF